MKNENYDIVIIGSGPGGYVAAIRAAQLNKKVLVVEKSELGGICLNWGCIPTKALLRTSEIYSYVKEAKQFGLEVIKHDYSLKNIVSRSREVSKTLSKGIEYLFKKNGIFLKKGNAFIEDNNNVTIQSNDSKVRVKTKNIIIATGAKAKKPTFLENSSNEIWSYKEAMIPNATPKSLGIVGSGAIGIEFACFYNELGTDVKVFEVQENIVPHEDKDISVALEKALLKKKITFYKNTKVVGLKKAESFELTTNTKEKIEKHHFEKVLIATGVEGNIENIGIENTKVRTKNNQIITHQYGMTDDNNIFAIGDVAGTPWLAHKASHEGIDCVEYISGLKSINTENIKQIIPSCIYSNPQVASIGLTEQEATTTNKSIKVGTFPLSANGKALALNEPNGFVKTIFDSKTGEILGAHMIGTEVTELINTFSLAIKLEATEEDIINTIFPHPTLSESIHESVLSAFNRSIHS